MRVRARVPLEAGEFSRFSDTLLEKLVGETTSDGWLVIEAEQETDQLIWLIIEKDMDELPSELQPL